MATKAELATVRKTSGTLFECRADRATEVFLAGTFNQWEPRATPMQKSPDGTWSVLLALPPGRYEYKFLVDGAWCCEPGCADSDSAGANCAPNPFGTMNRVIEVA